MSGPPTPEHPIESSQAAGRRRKRSDTSAARANSPAGSPVVAGSTAVSESPAERWSEVVVTTGISIQPATWPAPYPVAQSYGFGGGASGPSGLPTSSFEPQYGPGSGSPETSSKSKVHVPSACFNCKKKHLRCSTFRPCLRCIQTHKEDGCVDVQHRKRGRPPLKPEADTACRVIDMEANAEAGRPRGSPLESSRPDAQSYPYPYVRHSVTSRGSLPPAPARQGGLHRPHLPLAPNPYGMYAPSNVGSNYATAPGTSFSSSAPRPPSSSSSVHSSLPPSPHYQTPSTAASPKGPLQGGSGYSGGFGRQPPTQESYPSSNSPYNSFLFPRRSAQQQVPFEAPPSAYTPQQSIAPELQLPPIRPAPPGADTNPGMAQHQQRQFQQEQERDLGALGRPADNATTTQPEAKRPRMSLGNIVNPPND